ncbi:MAG: hypothetical protein AAF743_04680 [Planctomycetota bacterium]
MSTPVAEPTSTDERVSGSRPFVPVPVQKPGETSWVDRAEAFLSRLSSRDHFWHRIFSFLFLPLAFWSGVRMKQLDGESYSAVLPFKKFNKNWYNAMAGASLLANTEIAGGMYVFGEAGGDYTVVCKHLDYQFMRPCFGPAIYRMTPRENLKELVAGGSEFNITLDIDVRQQGFKPDQRDKRVGKAEITFHVTPKTQYKEQKKKRKVRDKARKALRKSA